MFVFVLPIKILLNSRENPKLSGLIGVFATFSIVTERIKAPDLSLDHVRVILKGIVLGSVGPSSDAANAPALETSITGFLAVAVLPSVHLVTPTALYLEVTSPT